MSGREHCVLTLHLAHQQNWCLLQDTPLDCPWLPQPEWSTRAAIWYYLCKTASCCGRDVTNGFQLYQSDPSGNYGGWKATAIGANSQGAQNILKQDFKDDISLEEAVKLIIKVPMALACSFFQLHACGGMRMGQHIA